MRPPPNPPASGAGATRDRSAARRVVTSNCALAKVQALTTNLAAPVRVPGIWIVRGAGGTHKGAKR